MATTGFSALAHQYHEELHVVGGRTAPIYGVCLHQTGEDIAAQAVQLGIDPLEHAAAYYLKPDSYFAHYVIGYGGVIIQLAAESEKTPHVGYPPDQHAALLDGSWEKQVSAVTVQLWHERWPHFKAPADLFPGPSPNNVYVGVEMIPIVDGSGATPMFDGALFTAGQHQAAADLCHDIGARNSLPDGWQLGNRLVGHEDLNPISRSSKSGGWDPGALRAAHWFDFDWVRTHITAEYAPGNA